MAKYRLAYFHVISSNGQKKSSSLEIKRRIARIEVDYRAVSWRTGTRGILHGILFACDVLFSCSLLFSLCFVVFVTGTRGQNRLKFSLKSKLPLFT